MSSDRLLWKAFTRFDLLEVLSGTVEAAQVTVRSLPEWHSKYVHLTMRRGREIAKVAMARKAGSSPWRGFARRSSASPRHAW